MRFTTTIASATVAAVLGVAGVSVAGATSSTGSSDPTASTVAASNATTPKATTSPAKKAKRATRRRHARRRAAALAAKTIGVTRAALVSELRSGKTIAAIATEHGVQPQAVIDALEAAGTAKIDAAQAANRITAARAAQLKLRLDRAVPRIVNTWHLRDKAAA
jgi:hypothetical protein